MRLRRLVPTGLALAATDAIYRAALRLSVHRRVDAHAAVRAVVGHGVVEQQIAELASSHVTAQARGWELTWRPWELEAMPIRGREHLELARLTERGIVVSHAHLGPLAGWVPLGRMLRPLYHPVGEWATHDPFPGYRGYQVEQRRRLFQQAGIELLPAAGSALPLFKILRGGGAALISMDAPGERTSWFLGKPVELDDGTAHLAARTNALVVPAALLPAGRRWEMHLFEPLDPLEYDSPQVLHQALVAVHEQLIMRAPEHLEDPRRLWTQASADGWFG